MTEWINRFRRVSDFNDVVHEFRCHCPPDSRSHERMISGALRNMRDDCWLDDGRPAEPPEKIV